MFVRRATARSRGEAGGSADQEFRRLSAGPRIPVWVLALGVLVGAVVVGDVVARLGGDRWTAVGIAALAGVALTTLRHWLGVVGSVAVTVVGCFGVLMGELLVHNYVLTGNPISARGVPTLASIVCFVVAAWKLQRADPGRPWLGMVLTVALGWLTVVGTMLASRSAEVACVALAGVVYLCVHGRRQGWRWSGLWLRLVQAQGTLQQQVSNLSDRIDSPQAGSYPDPEAQAWARGADGERRTAELLRGLGRDWVVFHDAAIPGARANVDHVAVGPTGVWVIDSKAWSPPVGVSEDARLTHRGQDLVAELSTTQWEALHVARLLGTSTRAVVCIHDAALPGQVTESLLVDEVPPSAVPADPFRITGQVTVVAPGALTATLQNEEHLPVQELREIRAKARHLLRPHGQVQPNVPTARIAYHADRTLVTTIDGVWLIDRGAPAETAPSGSSPTTEPAGSADASA